MRKRTTLLLSVLIMLFSLIPSGVLDAALPSRETTYTVYYGCIIGPFPTGPEGEWFVGCDGSWTGWGWHPGDNCTYTVVTYGDTCERDPY